MRKETFACFTCMVVIFGCHQNVSDDPKQQEIRFRGNIQKLQTVEAGTSRGGFANGTKVQLYIVERNGDVIAVPASEDLCQMVSDADGRLNFDDGTKHHYPSNPIDVYGYYCTGLEGEPSDLTVIPIAVESVQSTEEAVIRSDLLYVKATNGYVAGDAPIELEFGHQFSKLQFHFFTDTPGTVDLNKLTSVEILNVLTEGKFNLSTGEMTLGETLDDVKVRPENGASVIMLPQIISMGESLFRFVVDNEEYVCSVLQEGGEVFDKGKLYKYNVRLNHYPGMGDKEIGIVASVLDWDESEPPREVVIEKGEKVTVLLTEVAVGVEINRADLYMALGETSLVVTNIAVTDKKMEFVFPRAEKGGTAILERAHFYTSKGEEFDYYFSDKVLQGNNFDELALVMPRVGDAWGDGTIFVVGEPTMFDGSSNTFSSNTSGINRYRGRLVSNVSSGMAEWSLSKSAGNTVFVKANSRDDGRVNISALKNFIKEKEENLSFYPAFQECEDLGEGWYFPAINEIRAIVECRDKLNVNIEKQNGVPITLIEYGSSTEKNDSSKDYYITFKTGVGESSNTKFGQKEVRAVRAY